MPDGIKDTYKAFSNNLAKSTQEIIKIRKKSDEVTATDLPDHVDFAFIDGDHSFKSAQNDVQLLEPLMAKNSVLAFHDALYFQGVSQIIGDVLKRGNWRLEGQVNNLVWLRKHQFEQ
jgi:predicted O-methyltransferase YrrM